MSRFEERIMELIRQLREEIRMNDQRIKQLSGGSSGGIDLTALMLKAIYDQDEDGIVDNAKRLDGHTSDEFAPASHSHTESDLSFSDVTTGDVSAAKHGFCPKLPNDGSKFLDGTGSWSAVGDILEFVYDPDYQCLVVG